MGMTNYPLQKRTITATSALVKYRAVGLDGATAAADAAIFGILGEFNENSGSVVAAYTAGDVIAEVGAAVSAGNELEIGTDGKVIPYSNGQKIGRALETGAADGAYILVRLY